MDWQVYVLGHGSGAKSDEDASSRPSEFVCGRLRRTICAVAVLQIFLFPKIGACQDPPDSATKSVPTKRAPIFTDVTIWSAQSVGSTNVMSTYPGQEVFATGIGLRRHLYMFRHTNMRWNFQIMPLCIPSFPSSEERTYHYGGGGSFGLNLEPRKRWKLQPYFEGNVGLVGFTNPTPVDTRRMNYTLQFGPGFIIPVRGRSSVKTGIWFFHFSNMHSVATNPGFDALVIYMGYSFSFERRGTGPI